MNATFFLLPLAAVLMLMMPLVPIYKGVTTGQKAKHAVIFNLCAFFGVAALMIILPMGGFVTLAEGASAAAESGMTVGAGLGYQLLLHRRRYRRGRCRPRRHRRFLRGPQGLR